MLLDATLAGIDKRRSSELAPPWPDLVITAGRRNEPIARWIRKQAPQHVRIIHVGRPWSAPGRFDLVITTPQYRLPLRPNILHITAPLHRVTECRLAEEAVRWRDRLQHLRRPFVAVMVGGGCPPYDFTKRTAERLAQQASALASDVGGSLLISTSARTPAAAIDVLEHSLSVPAHLFRWSKDAMENPFFAFLGLADAIIVTGDSMSMLAEARATRKPLYIFDLGEGKSAMRPATKEIIAAAFPHLGPTGTGVRWLQKTLIKAVVALGPGRLKRDIRVIHKDLVDVGAAVWLGDRFPLGRLPPMLDCLDRVARVCEMMGHVAVGRLGERLGSEALSISRAP
jgi:uncharacterized protein